MLTRLVTADLDSTVVSLERRGPDDSVAGGGFAASRVVTQSLSMLLIAAATYECNQTGYGALLAW